jgi:hypothetical protein
MMDHYFPNSSWLRLRRDVFDRLYQYKIDSGIATWEQAIESLLPPANTSTTRQRADTATLLASIDE